VDLTRRLHSRLLCFACSRGGDWRLTDAAKLCEVLQCKNKGEVAKALTQLRKEGLIAVRKPIEPDPDLAFAEHGIQARSAVQVCMEVRDETDVVSLQDEPFEISSTFGGRSLRDYLDQKEQRWALGMADEVGVRITAAAAPVAADWMNPVERVASAFRDPDLGSLRKMAVEAARARADTWGAGAVAGAPPMAWQRNHFLEEARRSFAKPGPEWLSLMREIADRDRSFTGMQAVWDSYRGIGFQLEQAIRAHDQTREKVWGLAGLNQFVERQRRLSAGIVDVALGLPGVLAEYWPAPLMARRRALLEHTLKNVAVFEDLRIAAAHPEQRLACAWHERLAMAGEFVMQYPRFVRRLPPPIPREGTDEAGERRDQEIGAQLEARLRVLDPRLCELRRQAWAGMAKADEAGMRLAALGLREILKDVLHLLAPDEQVMGSEDWLNRKHQKPERPTRLTRVAFIVKGEAERAALEQFNKSVELANKFAHTFADEPELVRAHMAQLEVFMYLILIAADAKDN